MALPWPWLASGAARQLGNGGGLCHSDSMPSQGAYFLRETTGTSGLDRTVHDAVEILARHLIPHLIAGGLAVQEHGYYRVTLDADIIVPDVVDAAELLTADLAGPFVRYPGCDDTVRDQRN